MIEHSLKFACGRCCSPGPREKKGTYTLDRQYQIIVVCERKRGWNKIKFFFLFLTHKEHDVLLKEVKGTLGKRVYALFFFNNTQ